MAGGNLQAVAFSHRHNAGGRDMFIGSLGNLGSLGIKCVTGNGMSPLNSPLTPGMSLFSTAQKYPELP